MAHRFVSFVLLLFSVVFLTIHLLSRQAPWEALGNRTGVTYAHIAKSLTLFGTHLWASSRISYPTPEPFVRRIVSVGDLHGDLQNAKRVLRLAGVVGDDGNWTGDVDFFVQTGDIIDRGDDTIALFDWMDSLRSQAASVGGTVLSHLGNHEFMNAIGKPETGGMTAKFGWPVPTGIDMFAGTLRYVYPSEITTFGNVSARQAMLSTGRIGQSWAKNYTATSRLPLHPSLGPPNTPYPPFKRNTIRVQKEGAYDEVSVAPYDPLSHAAISFVHGGLSPTYKDLTPFPTRINELSCSLLRKLQRRQQPLPYPPNPYPGLPSGATQSEREFYASDGPLWYRGWALDSEETVCAKVDTVLAKTGTRRMIMGHTPNFERIVSRCDGKVIIIDTGITHAYGGVLSALSIQYSLVPIERDGDKQRWSEREVIIALYPHKREVLVDEKREFSW